MHYNTMTRWNLFVLLTLLHVATAEKRHTEVNVVNKTPNPLYGASLIHKYSDDYKNQKIWSVIAPGEMGNETLTVEYNTGSSTTGRDWWLVTWYDEKLDTQSYSSPANFRVIVDAIESVAGDAIAAAVGFAAGLVTAPGGPAALSAGVCAAALSSFLTSQIFNSESTKGFKQHILRDEDAGELTTIIINEDKLSPFTPIQATPRRNGRLGIQNSARRPRRYCAANVRKRRHRL
jgi:hypothetical protein